MELAVLMFVCHSHDIVFTYVWKQEQTMLKEKLVKFNLVSYLSDVSFRDHELDSDVFLYRKIPKESHNKSPNFMNKIKINHPCKALFILITNQNRYGK